MTSRVTASNSLAEFSLIAPYSNLHVEIYPERREAPVIDWQMDDTSGR